MVKNQYIVISTYSKFVVRISLLVEFKEIFEMRNTSVGSSSQQTNNKLNLIPRKVLCSKTFVRGK